MTDRELLELAAKAAGLPVEWAGDDFVIASKFRGHLTNYDPWNPLADDGDTLRLEVALKLSALWDGVQSRWIVTRAGLPGYLAADPDRKRASVRAAAAAEIGRSMT
jgi:hypothetical protein